jgi:FixJ family two-component response regulator
MSDRQLGVAVIDDDPSVRKALGRLLAVSGYRVELYASAGEFLAAAPDTMVDCLIIDCEIGEESGVDLANRLFDAGYRFPIVFMSGSGSGAIRKRATEFGCFAYLQKPFAQGELIDAIEAAAPQHAAMEPA